MQPNKERIFRYRNKGFQTVKQKFFYGENIFSRWFFIIFVLLLNKEQKKMVVEEKYMARCIELARGGEGNTAPNPMVGAVSCVIKERNHRGRVSSQMWRSACRSECGGFRSG